MSDMCRLFEKNTFIFIKLYTVGDPFVHLKGE